MSKLLYVIISSVLVLSSTSYANKPKPADPSQVVSGDYALVQAVQAQKGLNFVSAKGLAVTKLLPDDSQGLPHQKFNVKLSSGNVIMIVSNLDMCEHIPVQIGDVVSAGGQFIPTGKGSGLLHWTHKDPKHHRPDGFIQLGDHIFCQ